MTNTATLTERRSAPRTAAHPCPHCGHTAPEGHHFRDSGEMDPSLAAGAGFCPVLAERRRVRIATPFAAEVARQDARIAEAVAAGWTEDEPNYAAALAAEAL